MTATAAIVRRLPYALPGIIFALLVLYFWAGLGRNPHELPSVLLDRPVPSFALPPIKGAARGLTSDDLKGEVSLVNIFGSWCVACKAEHAFLMRLSREGTVPIYGINWREKDAADGPAWLARLGDPYRLIGADPDSRAAIALGVSGAPETFVIDRDGIIRHKHAGAVTAEVWDKELWPIVRRLQAR